jgi:hypothetical protein
MPSPRVALVDTTVLTDALLKPGPRSDRARQSLARYDETLLPAYAIREFKAGPFRAFLWLHNKYAFLGSHEQAVGAIQKISRGWQPNLVSTALEALQIAAQNFANSLGELVREYTPSADPDKVIADRYRLALKRIIYLAWRERRRITTRVTHELACFVEGELTVENSRVEVARFGCSPDSPCGLQDHLRPHLPEIRALLSSNAFDGEKSEIQKRRKVLKDFARKPNDPIKEGTCRRIGDAAFVLLAPKGATILTTNPVDFVPMAKVLGKIVETPDPT